MRGGHSDRSQDRGHGAHDASTGELAAKARIPSIKMQTEPASPVADRPTLLRFFVTDSAASNPIREFDLVHGRRMHLVVVSEDLAFFDHVHPELRDGVFQLAFTFPEAGPYRLWAEATPKGGERALVAFRLRVKGGLIHQPIAPIPDRETTKAVMDGQYRVTLMPRDVVAAEKPVVLTFSLARPDGSPVTDLRPLMSAGGHCVVISEDAQTFVHVHPTREVDASWRGGPDVAFETTFPAPGLYKVWGQFLRVGKVITAAFVLDVAGRGQSDGLTSHEEGVRHHDDARGGHEERAPLGP